MTDIEIAQAHEMKPITEIAAAAGIDEQHLELYGKYKAKLDLTEIRKLPRKAKLIGSLNFAYEISSNLYALYVFCKNELARTLYENRMDGLEEADKVMRRLYHSFAEAAKQDTSAPIMSNTQQIYAGMTYGRNQLNENDMDYDRQRGFFV